jgi:hypothetical protein
MQGLLSYRSPCNPLFPSAGAKDGMYHQEHPGTMQSLYHPYALSYAHQEVDAARILEPLGGEVFWAFEPRRRMDSSGGFFCVFDFRLQGVDLHPGP